MTDKHIPRCWVAYKNSDDKTSKITTLPSISDPVDFSSDTGVPYMDGIENKYTSLILTALNSLSVLQDMVDAFSDSIPSDGDKADRALDKARKLLKGAQNVTRNRTYT